MLAPQRCARGLSRHQARDAGEFVELTGARADFVRAAGFDPAEITDCYAFGNEPPQLDELAELVVHGPKRATTALARWYGDGAARFPVVGDLVLVVASAQRPSAIVRVTAVEIAPFASVDAQFAWEEGEGDRSLAYWRSAHRAFFAAEAAAGGFTFAQTDPVVLCRFELVWPQRAPGALA